ncbi:hypothetical protein D3C86_1845010 [compost metagenome]
MLARRRIVAHAFFGSTRWPVLPVLGNTKGEAPNERLRVCKTVTTSGDNVTFCGVPFFVMPMRQTPASRSISRHAIS